MADNDIIQELKELGSSIPVPSSRSIYSLPPSGYFEAFANTVMGRIKAIEAVDASEELSHLSPLLGNIPKSLPYTVPEGYFDQFQEDLIAGIHGVKEDFKTVQEELNSLSPLLGSINRKNVYTVPEGYFENLQTNIRAGNTARPKAKVVSMINRKKLRYAMAAAVIGIIALTGILFLNRDNSPDISNTHAWIEKNTNKLSTDDINNFVRLADADDELPAKNNFTASAKQTDIKELMKDVSDKDIQDFLNKTSAGDEGDDDVLLN